MSGCVLLQSYLIEFNQMLNDEATNVEFGGTLSCMLLKLKGKYVTVKLLNV